MTMTIGIDIGGSTTKIVGYAGGQIISPLMVRATDPLASVYGAFGKFISSNGLSLGDIDHISVTGVGASFIKSPLYSLKTYKVDEFLATGLGGLHLTGLERAVIVSMGTGTAFVKAEKNATRHMGGTGVGGGTLLGLSNRMLNVRSFDNLIEMAETGNLSNIDLSIQDITKDTVSGFPPETTASNFGKISDLATRNDIALGIINLVFQTIGMLAIFASRIEGDSDVVLTGNLTTVPQARYVFDELHRLFGVNFRMPPFAEYATAVGAAIAPCGEGNLIKPAG